MQTIRTHQVSHSPEFSTHHEFFLPSFWVAIKKQSTYQFYMTNIKMIPKQRQTRTDMP